MHALRPIGGRQHPCQFAVQGWWPNPARNPETELVPHINSIGFQNTENLMGGFSEWQGEVTK